VVVVEELTAGGTAGAATGGGTDDGGDTAEDPEPMGGVDIMGEDIMGAMGGGDMAEGGIIMGIEEGVATAGGGMGVAIDAVAVGGTTTVVADMAIEEEDCAIAPAIAAPEPEEDMPMLFMYAVVAG
jgi:hypothetical protein